MSIEASELRIYLAQADRNRWTPIRYVWTILSSLLLAGCAGPRLKGGEAAIPPPPPAYRTADLEIGVLVKRLKEGDLLIRRADGSHWILVPKTNCSWCWINEGKKVYLQFGYTSTILISLKGQVIECWTEGKSQGY